MPVRFRSLQSLLCTAVLAAFAGLAAPATGQPRPGDAALSDLRAGTSATGGSWIHLKADGPLERAVIFELDAPRRLVVDLPRTVLAGVPRTLALHARQASGVRLGEHPDKLRLVIDAEGSADPLSGRRVLPTLDGLVIAFGDVNPLQLPVAPILATAEGKLAPLPPARVAQALEEPAPKDRAPELDRPENRAVISAQTLRIYGLELERSQGRERLLVFANEPVRFEITETGPETLELRIENAVLDASALRSLNPEVSGPFVALSTREIASPKGPVVIFEILREEGISPEVSQRGGLLALDFPRPRDSSRRRIALQLEDVDVKEVIAAIARETGQPFLHNDELIGRLTLLVADRVTPEEALQLLDAGLQMLGFATVPTPGGLLRVVEIETASREAPFEDPLRSGHRGSGEALVTTLARLEAADAASVASALQPWQGPSSQAYVHAPTNAIILAGSEKRLRHLLALIRALDHAAQEDLIVRRLRHRDASQIAELAATALSRDAPAEPLEIWADARTNSVLARATPDRLDELRAFIARIDRPATGGGSLSVVRILNQDPEQIAERLRELARAPGGEDLANPGRRMIGSGTLLGRDFDVAVDTPTNSLILRADPETARAVRQVIDVLDRRPSLVSVDVHVVEVDMADSLSLGIDFFVPLTRPSKPGDLVATFLSNPSQGGLRSFEGADTRFFGRYTRAPLVIPITDESGVPLSLIVPRESVVVMADGRDIHARTLIRPNLVMVPGEEHAITSGANIPIPVSGASEPGDLGGLLQTRVDIERQDIGVTLRMKPSVAESGRVTLDLDLQTSELAPSLAGPVAQVGPTLSSRNLQSTISLGSGELAVIGTLAEERNEDLVSGTPFLKDIPLFGRLFMATKQTRRKSHLLIAVSARVLKNPADQLAESLRQRLAFERSAERLAALDAMSDAPYALHVATRRVAGDAEAIADHFDSGSHRALVSRWGLRSRPHYDVYLTGYRTLVDASRAALDVEKAGFRPQLVVVPDAGPRLSRRRSRGEPSHSIDDLDPGPHLDAVEELDHVGIAHPDTSV